MLSDIMANTSQCNIVEVTLLCYGFEIMKASNGTNYLQFKAQDASGIVGCKMWGYTNTVVPEDLVYDIRCKINEYNGVIGFIAEQLSPRKDQHPSWYSLKYVNEEEFVDIVKKVDNLIKSIKSYKMMSIVYNVFKDYGLYSQSLAELFKSPIAVGTGAVIHHHVGWGGLLKHTCEVAIRAVSYLNKSPAANRDLVVAGALLHDIGKIFSYELVKGHYEISTRGHLIGHIGIGIEILSKYLTDDNEDIIMLLQHIIASHHDKVEWGALTRPQMIEAFIVSQADLADCIQELLINAEELYPDKDAHKIMGMRLFSPHVISNMINT